MLGKLNTRLDLFDNRFNVIDERMIGIEGELGRIRRHRNILISDAKIKEEEEFGDDEEEEEGAWDEYLVLRSSASFLFFFRISYF